MTDTKDMAETLKDADKFEQFLFENPFTGEPENLYASMNYIMQLGGKRMRPKLLLMAYESVSGQLNTDAYKMALAIETFHNFSLIHDDIMDNAPIRRGKKTVHETWDNATAILAGDNLLTNCYRLILETAIANKETVLKIFTKVATEVCEGQQMDMNLPSQTNVAEAEYLEMIRLKTAVLPAAALQIGALAAGATNDIAEEFYQFGLNLGMAFQLQDDYLDAFGSSEVIGKQAGGDILENKKTIIFIHAVNNLDTESKASLTNWYTQKVHDNALKITAVRQLFKQSKSDLYLLELKNKYEEDAIRHLEKACRNENIRNEFLNLFNSIKTREK